MLDIDLDREWRALRGKRSFQIDIKFAVSGPSNIDLSVGRMSIANLWCESEDSSKT